MDPLDSRHHVLYCHVLLICINISDINPALHPMTHALSTNNVNLHIILKNVILKQYCNMVLNNNLLYAAFHDTELFHRNHCIQYDIF